MSPQESPAYIATLRKRIAAIRENSTLLKNKVTGTMRRARRDSQGGPARQSLAASLAAHCTDVKSNSPGLCCRNENADAAEALDRKNPPGATDEMPDDAESMVKKVIKDESEDKVKEEGVLVQEKKHEEERGAHADGPTLNSHRIRKVELEEGTGMYNRSPQYAAVWLCFEKNTTVLFYANDTCRLAGAEEKMCRTLCVSLRLIHLTVKWGLPPLLLRSPRRHPFKSTSEHLRTVLEALNPIPTQKMHRPGLNREKTTVLHHCPGPYLVPCHQ